MKIILTDRPPVQINPSEWSEVLGLYADGAPNLFEGLNLGFIRILQRDPGRGDRRMDCLVYGVVTSRCEGILRQGVGIDQAGYLIDGRDSELLARTIGDLCSDLGWPFPIAHACLSRMLPEIL